MSAGHLIINAMYHGLTVKVVVSKYKATNRAQLNMKAYRLMRNRMIVMLGFDFHIVLTSEGNVRIYSYAYQAILE